MNFFRKKNKPAEVDIDQGPLSVFQDSADSPRTPSAEAEDLNFVDVTGKVAPRDDDAPFGPEMPEHLVAPRERRRRRIRFGGMPVRSEPAQLVAEEQALSEPFEGAARHSDKPELAVEVGLEAADDSPLAMGEPDKPRKTIFNRGKSGKGERKAREGKLFTLSKKAAAGIAQNLPIRVLIGYMPEVSEKDALGFALGIADKHVENIELAHYDAFPYANGFVYEVHEGGTGHAFVPAILEHFESLGPYRSDGDARMHIRTSTRVVEVTRKDQGLESVLLPESASLPDSPAPTAGAVMRPAMNKRQGLLVAGAALFITGTVLALVIGLFMRLVPVEEVMAPKAEEIRPSETPLGQWSTRLQNVPDGKYVKALRYDKTAGWRVENGDIVEPQQLGNQP